MRNEFHVAVVEDHDAMRGLVRRLLEDEGLSVRCFESAESLLESDDRIRYSCLVLDHWLPGISGLDLFAELRRRGNPVPVVMISGQATVAEAMAAFRDGISAFFEKPFSNTELVATVLHLATDWAETQARRELATTRLAQLSPRENEVLDSLVAGKKTTQIARELNISASTVEKHRLHIFAKTGVQSVIDLVHLVLNGASSATSRPTNRIGLEAEVWRRSGLQMHRQGGTFAGARSAHV